MEPTWRESTYYRRPESNNLHSVYPITLSKDEFIQELSNKIQEKLEVPPTIMSLYLPEPVRVIKNPDGVEEIRYNSSMMKPDQIYEVVWNGRQYGVRKTAKDVEILRFYPDST